MVFSIALNEEFNACCTVLDSNNCGRASKIHDVPRRLVHAPHTAIANLLDNIPTAGPPQFQRKLQKLFWCRRVFVYRMRFRYFQVLN